MFIERDNMKLKLLSVLLSSLLIVGLTACAESDSKEDSLTSNESMSSSTAVEISADELINSAAADNMTEKAYYADDIFKSNTKKLYGIDYDEIVDGAIAYGDNGSADELSVLKLKEGASAKNLLEARLSNRKTQFENYKPSEMPKLESAQIYETNGFWIMIVSDDTDSIKGKLNNIMG